ncbi:MAG: hypothetical protein K8I82_25135 [Anaerolineae bacterium]|nr:hypothetical protein [Anaerolineae bacterium]
MFRKITMITGLMIFVLLLAGCGGVAAFSANETVSNSFDVSAGTVHVVVEMFNGSIGVETGSDGTVSADVLKHASGGSQQAAQDNLKTIEVMMTQEGDTLRIIAWAGVNLDNTGRGASVRLRVPPGTTLDLLTSNGAITISGAVSDTDAMTSNAGITVSGSSGTLNVETSNGAIDITAENVTVTGTTSNAQFRFSGSLAAGASQMHTSNARITVTLPADAAFTLSADTSNADITSAFSVTQRESGEDYLRGTVGSSPETTLDLETSNASIEIHQAG